MQLKGIKSSKRPLQVIFQRNAKVLDDAANKSSENLPREATTIADERLLGAIPKWEEYAKAVPEYWEINDARVTQMKRELSSLSVAEVGQLLTSWAIYKVIIKPPCSQP